MGTLNEPMKWLIESYSAGAVATINEDGTPAVSPKATFVVLNDETVAFGNIRSPGTVANIRRCADVEVNFIDVLTRRAVRIKGRAQIVEKDSDAGQGMIPAFEARWAPYMDVMRNFVAISITHAQLILSPAYDLGHTAEDLRQVNMDKLRGLGS